MITLINQNNVEYRQHFWRGLASDGLPMLPDFNTKNGDIYQEMDTGRLYMFSDTGSDWVEIYLGEEGEIVTVSGVSPIDLPDALIREIQKVVQYGKIEQDGTPTTANPVDIVCNNGALKWDSENQRIYADGTPEVITVSADGVADQTASVENLLAYEDIRDEQDIISGKVMRRTEAFMYDGSQTVGSRYISTTGGKDTGAIIVRPLGNEYSGNVVSFEAEDGKPIDSLSVTLSPKQEGTGDPSPDNIRPITGTDEAVVVRTGKNLFETSNAGYKNESGVWFNGTDIADVKAFINTLPVGTYVISFKFDVLTTVSGATSWGILIHNTASGYLDGRMTGQHNSGETLTFTRTVTITESNQGKFDHVYLYSGGGSHADVYWYDFQLELGSEATAYEPYLSATLSLEWGALGKNLLNCEVVASSTSRANIVNKDDGTTLFPLKAGTYTFSNNGGNAYAYWRKEGTTDNNIIHTSGGTNYGTFTLTEDANYMFWLYANSIDASKYTEIQLEKGSTKTTYEPYTRTIYGGRVDAISGVGVITMANIASYNGESINEPWISSMDAYSAGAVPTTGAQVVYPLAQPIPLTLDPHTLTALAKNTVWSDAGAVDVFLSEELVEQVAPQELKTSKGTNTITVTANVPADLEVEYTKKVN